MKRCQPFYIGATNIYDYQTSGFYRWNTFQAAAKVAVRIAFEAPLPRKKLPPKAEWPFPTGRK
jgi:hypothetical protein